ncbi:CDF family Co(II)/Ni(II) efflux transporter DmeF [Pseudomonas triticifolii]|uniref:CDF family Co(II)/Ni(II) efflux transporter DmeF n=1 Tax=Pseudomonas triticifolii TaxID=2762592 RepID=A0ABR7BDC5_9PSED|nr:CDF family Co(II)/Ni(II) efflux transporter DmeF [Pseudomonas triticifolii]MBC3955163.1 CDF family Co(II)/Ni(II) efflux transporter DmeF [Pseudomonas triticifolii]
MIHAPHGHASAEPHHHVFLGAAHDRNARRTLWVVALTFVMMVIEIVAGYITGSMALLADGLHMATHAGALGIAAGAYAFARRNAHNSRFSFGTGKVGDLAGFASALILAMVSLGIGIESLVRLFQPTAVAFGEATVIAVIGLAVNVLSAVLLSGGHGHAHGHHDHGHSHDHGDNNFRSAYLHVMADALTSVLAIAALLAGRYLGWVWLDPLMGIVGACVIAKWAYGLIKDSSRVLLDVTDEHVAAEIREVVQAIGNVTIIDLHVWRVGPQAHAAIVSVLADIEVPVGVIRDRLGHVHEVSHLTIEYQAAHA